MELKKQKTFVYWFTAVLFVVGVVCYAAFPDRTPAEPVRIMFSNTAGNVLFDHKTHTAPEAYGFDCIDCHHELEDGEPEALACSECHLPGGEDEFARSEVFHQQCNECHEAAATAPIDCAECHVRL